MSAGRLDDVQALAGAHGLRVSRAWPRDPGHLLLDLTAGDGGHVAAQWFADEDRAARTAVRTGPPARACGGLLLQPHGADRRLPGLAPLLNAGGVLVAHRPERRAVVRSGDGHFTKVVRPGTTAAVASAARAAAVPGVRVPDVLRVDEGAGTVTTRALPGRTLHELLGSGCELAATAAAALGTTLAALHAAPPPPGAPVHDGRAELDVLRRWHGHAVSYGLLPAGLVPAELVEALLADVPGGVPVHRDLHDKQVLVDDDGAVGILDFDLAAVGEPALDLANLLVHLRWRVEQGHAPPDLVQRCSDAVLQAYEPSAAVLARLPAYATASRLRLQAVYRFRPAG